MLASVSDMIGVMLWSVLPPVVVAAWIEVLGAACVAVLDKV